MHVIKARNVNGVLSDALWRLRTSGVETDSRNGLVIKLDRPLAVEYVRPWERVLFDPLRDANPFFHFMESIWMLGGRDDLAFLEQFVARMREFSDDGVTFHGAYGYRWRYHFEMDQIAYVGRLLQECPSTRRAVVAMWDPAVDLTLDNDMKDLPCNTTAMFQVNEGVLDMMVTNRSNDIILGMCGANAVHFSFLHEFVCKLARIPMGRYYQVTFNAHAYLNDQARKLMAIPYADDRYLTQNLRPLRLQDKPELLDEDILAFLGDPTGEPVFQTSFFNEYVTSIWDAHRAHRSGDKEGARNCIATMPDCDWKMACGDWLARRYGGSLER